MKLLPFTIDDQPVMLKLLTHPKIRETYMLPDFEKPEDAIPLFRRLLALSQQGNHFIRGIYHDCGLVGFINDVESKDHTIELGYVIHPEHWGKNYATAALKLAIEELFRLGYREIQAGAFSENTASVRVMEKAGMIPMKKQDEIEYRSILHTCVYRHITI